MKYWIIIDDRHAGPFSAQQLLDTGLTPDTLVWTEGMPDWTRAANVAELAEGLRLRDMPQQQEVSAHSDSSSEPAAEENAAPDEAGSDAEERVCTETVIVTTVHTQPESQPEPQLQPQGTCTATVPAEPCPPAYIAWSIIATLLCCTIVGIPAIVFASMTKSAYYRGDIAKSKRYSEITQWFIIAAITLGAISWPFQMAFMSMFQ